MNVAMNNEDITEHKSFYTQISIGRIKSESRQLYCLLYNTELTFNIDLIENDSRDRAINRTRRRCYCRNCSSGRNSPSSDKEHICSYSGCMKVYKKVYDLKVHEVTHSGIYTTNCLVPDCMKQFATLDRMHKHMMVHCSTRTFRCVPRPVSAHLSLWKLHWD